VPKAHILELAVGVVKYYSETDYFPYLFSQNFCGASVSGRLAANIVKKSSGE